MPVQCPVPLASAWSPVGYNVVEVASQSGVPNAALPDIPRAPSSPLGYRVVKVADEQAAGAAAAPGEASSARSKPTTGTPPYRRLGRGPLRARSQPMMVWAPVVVATALFGVLIVWLVSWAATPDPERADRLADARDGEPIVIPKADPAKAVKPAKPAEKAAPAGALPAAVGCDVCPRGERDNFGTAVAFARNPIEASRDAATADRLTFILHVSGNFEDAGFT